MSTAGLLLILLFLAAACGGGDDQYVTARSLEQELLHAIAERAEQVNVAYGFAPRSGAPSTDRARCQGAILASPPDDGSDWRLTCVVASELTGAPDSVYDVVARASGCWEATAEDGIYGGALASYLRLSTCRELPPPKPISSADDSETGTSEPSPSLPNGEEKTTAYRLRDLSGNSFARLSPADAAASIVRWQADNVGACAGDDPAEVARRIVDGYGLDYPLATPADEAAAQVCAASP